MFESIDARVNVSGMVWSPAPAARVASLPRLRRLTASLACAQCAPVHVRLQHVTGCKTAMAFACNPKQGCSLECCAVRVLSSHHAQSPTVSMACFWLFFIARCSAGAQFIPALSLGTTVPHPFALPRGTARKTRQRRHWVISYL